MSDFLASTAIAFGIVIPVTAAVELSQPPVDMGRYKMKDDCVESYTFQGETVARTVPCIIDEETGRRFGRSF